MKAGELTSRFDDRLPSSHKWRHSRNRSETQTETNLTPEYSKHNTADTTAIPEAQVPEQTIFDLAVADDNNDNVFHLHSLASV